MVKKTWQITIADTQDTWWQKTKKKINPKAMGLFAYSYILLAHHHKDNILLSEKYREKTKVCIDWLLKNAVKDFGGMGWGYPFDWQSVYISMTLKDNSKHILQPVPLELVDDEFDINGWNVENAFSGVKYKKNFLYKDTDLKKTVTVSSENRLGWTLKRKNTATLFKIGIPMFFLTFLVYYSVFLGFDKSGESIGILTTTFLSAIALYFSVEKPEPKKLTIIDIIFIWFYIVLEGDSCEFLGISY